MRNHYQTYNYYNHNSDITGGDRARFRAARKEGTDIVDITISQGRGYYNQVIVALSREETIAVREMFNELLADWRTD